MSSDIVSSSRGQLAKPAKVNHLARLIEPYQTISVGGMTILYYLKVEGKPGSVNLRNPDPETRRKVAMLTFKGDTFNLSWWPADAEEAQIAHGLPMERLPAAVEDLVGAGFGRKGGSQTSAGQRDAEVYALPVAKPLALDTRIGMIDESGSM